MRPESPLLELGVILGIYVRRRQHDIDIVGGEGRRAFRPIVDDLETDLQPLLAEDRVRLSIQSAVRDKASGAPDPHIHAYPHLGVTTRR